MSLPVKKLTELSGLTNVGPDDLLYIVHEVGETPTSFKVAVSDLLDAVPGLAITSAATETDLTGVLIGNGSTVDVASTTAAELDKIAGITDFGSSILQSADADDARTTIGALGSVDDGTETDMTGVLVGDGANITAYPMGDGGGLDADTLDGKEAEDFAELTGASFTGAVTVTGAALRAAHSSGAAFSIETISAGFTNMQRTTASGPCTIAFDPIPSDGTSLSEFRLFQNVNTTGVAELTFYRGNGTTAVQHKIRSKGGPTYFCLIEGDFGIGTNSPSAKLDVNGHIRARGVIRHNSYTVATLPTTGISAMSSAYASDGRKSGEGSGSGTGCPVWYDGSNWKTYYDNTTVAS